jgi:acyl-[acyl-carrier-protein]-phospholipid O-acyltransferase / long-chain-fatty-acid--[acyl-carrier-protein] ligase
MGMAQEDSAFSRQESCWSLGFISLLFTQLLTAISDHSFRWFAVGIAKDFAVAGHEHEHNANMMALGVVAFALPCLLFAAPAGYLADRFSKRWVIVGCKLAEIGILAIGLAGVAWGNLNLVFLALALLGTHTTLFAPAKYGAIPEILAAKHLSKANGAFQLVTVVAMVIGTVLGSYLADVAGHRGAEHLQIPFVTFGGIAILGVLISCGVGWLPTGDVTRQVPWNIVKQTWSDLHDLWSYRPLFRVALGIMFFYAVGSLAQMNIDHLATQAGVTTESAKSPLLVALILGVSIGAIVAGLASGERVELGILPIGSAGVAISSLMLFTINGDVFSQTHVQNFALWWACFCLLSLGVSAGFFLVPLESYMQHHSEPSKRGSLLAASNFLSCVGTLITTGLFVVLAKYEVLPRTIFLIAGIATIPVFIYIVWLIPQALIRFIVWLACHTVYRVSVTGREHLPERGGAVITPNHVSWLDPVLLLITSSRPVRFVAWSGNFENRLMLWLADLFGVILVNARKPKMIVAALKTAREAVLNGELVCIFPEGGISRTGQMLAFKTGLMRILDGTNAPVIPAYLDGLWGSIFSFERGKFFWKWPKKLPYPVAIHFGPQVEQSNDLNAIQQSVAQLGTTAVKERIGRLMLLPSAFLRTCKLRLRKSKIADSVGTDMTGGELLTRTLILRRMLRRHVLQANEKCVGLLLPPSAGAYVANMALSLDKRITVNLNYTVKADVMNFCIQEAGIKHVITSRKFMDKLELTGLQAELIYLEDFKDKVTLSDKIIGASMAYVMPSSLVEAILGLKAIQASDTASIIFTSGSTGTPKGVMVSHGNLLFNVEAIDQVVQLRPTDVILGVLPFFHVFGYTVSLWGVAGLNIKGAYHFSPLDAKVIGNLCEKHAGTLLIATPTFLRGYVRRCDAAQFKTLDVVVTGAEKLPPDVRDAFKEKFNVEPVEGFGATETTPLVSVNVPPSRKREAWHTEIKPGTVGTAVSGVTVRVVSTETGAILPTGEAGMLQVKGPNIMQGYLNRPDLTAEVIKDGWYITGDIAKIDEDGFITITGRQSRFSKIGGEMVPHIQIEEMINQVIGASDDEMKAAITAVPDERKGERIVVLHTAIEKTPDEICKALTAAGLPNLFIPGTDSFFLVDCIPVLGTGKLDLKALKTAAFEKCGIAQH